MRAGLLTAAAVGTGLLYRSLNRVELDASEMPAIKITLTAMQPPSTWNLQAPSECGFYANVNPQHDHPRWSQATEQRIGESGRRPTLPFNGDADQVAGLYAGMDLDVNF